MTGHITITLYIHRLLEKCERHRRNLLAKTMEGLGNQTAKQSLYVSILSSSCSLSYLLHKYEVLSPGSGNMKLTGAFVVFIWF